MFCAALSVSVLRIEGERTSGSEKSVLQFGAARQLESVSTRVLSCLRCEQ